MKLQCKWKPHATCIQSVYENVNKLAAEMEMGKTFVGKRAAKLGKNDLAIYLKRRKNYII